MDSEAIEEEEESIEPVDNRRKYPYLLYEFVEEHEGPYALCVGDVVDVLTHEKSESKKAVILNMTSDNKFQCINPEGISTLTKLDGISIWPATNDGRRLYLGADSNSFCFIPDENLSRFLTSSWTQLDIDINKFQDCELKARILFKRHGISPTEGRIDPESFISVGDFVLVPFNTEEINLCYGVVKQVNVDEKFVTIVNAEGTEQKLTADDEVAKCWTGTRSFCQPACSRKLSEFKWISKGNFPFGFSLFRQITGRALSSALPMMPPPPPPPPSESELTSSQHSAAVTPPNSSESMEEPSNTNGLSNMRVEAQHCSNTVQRERKKRNSYDDRDLQRVWTKWNQEGRMAAIQLGDSLGMPKGTVDSVLNRFRKRQKVAAESGADDDADLCHDRRHDKEGHEGRNAKTSAEAFDMIADRWELTPEATYEQLRQEINKERMRSLAFEKMGEEFLGENERHVGQHLDVRKCKRERDIMEAYEKVEVKSNTTIWNWSKSKFCPGFSFKVSVAEKTTANTPENMAKRLEYARSLQAKLESPDWMTMHLDEEPFYTNMKRSKAHAQVGRRAVVKVPPCSKYAHRTQIAMAVCEEYGLLYGNAYPPQHQEVVTRRGDHRTVYKSCYTSAEFKDFCRG